MQNSTLSFQLQSLNKVKNKFLLTLLTAICFLGFSYAQFDIPEPPKKQISVYDYIDLLQPSQKTTLEHKLIKYSDSTSTQIVIAIISSTNGEDIGFVAPNWGHKWGVGQEKEDNGIFILLAKDDRKIWIAPGYGVENKLTAGVNGQLIRNVILPEFKKGNYYSGLNKGTDAIFQVLNGEFKGQPRKKNNEFPIGLIIILLFIFFIILISISKNRRGGGGNNGRGGGRRSTATDILDAIILSNMGRSSSSGNGWGSSGGGFGSGGGFSGGFGGGGFSGGGAGGSW